MTQAKMVELLLGTIDILLGVVGILIIWLVTFVVFFQKKEFRDVREIIGILANNVKDLSDKYTATSLEIVRMQEQITDNSTHVKDADGTARAAHEKLDKIWIFNRTLKTVFNNKFKDSPINGLD